VVVLAGDDGAEVALRLGTECWSQAKPFLAAGRIGRDVAIGPLVTAGVPGCRECVGRHAAGDAVARPGATSSSSGRDWGNETLADAYVANLVALEVLKYFSKAPECETRGAVVVFEKEALRATRHPLVPRADCPVCSPFARPVNGAMAIVAALPE